MLITRYRVSYPSTLVTTMITSIIVLLLAHWLADFVFQTDWMATNKSTSMDALFTHTTIYSIVLLIVILPFNCNIMLIPFILVNWILHTLVDFITSRITKTLHTNGDIHNFFVVVGFDQFIHAATLIATASYFHLL